MVRLEPIEFELVVDLARRRVPSIDEWLQQMRREHAAGLHATRGYATCVACRLEFLRGTRGLEQP